MDPAAQMDCLSLGKMGFRRPGHMFFQAILDVFNMCFLYAPFSATFSWEG